MRPENLQALNHLHLLLNTPTALDDPAKLWCLPPGQLWWSNAMLEKRPLRSDRALVCREDSQFSTNGVPCFDTSHAQQLHDMWPQARPVHWGFQSPFGKAPCVLSKTGKTASIRSRADAVLAIGRRGLSLRVSHVTGADGS